jgi:arsenate reductase
MSIQVYGIPSCSTCRRALQWLDQHEVVYAFINTRETPPSRNQIAAWTSTLGIKPLRNTSGQSYRALGAVKEDWTDTQWLDAFAQDAMLLRRPLFVVEDKAVAVGFKDKDIELLRKMFDEGMGSRE